MVQDALNHFICQDDVINGRFTFISEDSNFKFWFGNKNVWVLADNRKKNSVLIRSAELKNPEEIYPYQISLWREKHKHDWIFNSAIRVEAITEFARVTHAPCDETTQPSLNHKRRADNFEESYANESQDANSTSTICVLNPKKSRVSTNLK